MINYDLARERGLDPKTIALIEEHQQFRETLGEMYEAGKLSRRIYKEEWIENEYMLQALWGFKEDPRYHKFWNMKGCTCPKLDNEDAYPTGFYTLNASCPLHGVV